MGKSAAEILRHLLAFGKDLEQLAPSAPQSSRSWQRGQRWGTWAQVDTDCAILNVTKDINLIRSLRAPKPGLTDMIGVAASKDSDEPTDEEQQTVVQPASEQPLAQLLHD